MVAWYLAGFLGGVAATIGPWAGLLAGPPIYAVLEERSSGSGRRAVHVSRTWLRTRQHALFVTDADAVVADDAWAARRPVLPWGEFRYWEPQWDVGGALRVKVWPSRVSGMRTPSRVEQPGLVVHLSEFGPR